jgi:NDP-sugar pyrophosphorylase family protein
LAKAAIDSDPFMVMNGDSYCGIDLKTYWDWHWRRRAAASMVLVRVQDSGRYGAVRLERGSRIADFVEKKDINEGWINAGIYLLGRDVLQSIPGGVFSSLERDIFPKWVGRGLYGYPSSGPFLDIGTPSDFASAEAFFSSLRARGDLNYGH